MCYLKFMYTLTPANTASVTFPLMNFATVGIFVISSAVIFFILLFSWSIKNSRKDILSLGIILILSITIPVSVAIIQRQTRPTIQAEIKIFLRDLNISYAPDNSAVITFTTSEPAIMYLEYKDNSTQETKTILPGDTIRQRTDHYFKIGNIGSGGGRATIMYRGNRYLINKEPIRLNPNP